MLNSLGGITAVWSSFYWAYNPYWKPLFIFILVMHVAVLIGLLFFPESPVNLYENGKYKDSKRVYAYIARANRVKDFNEEFIFDKEISSLERTPKPLNKTEFGTEIDP